MVFYAVANGRTNGIFLTWSECNTSVKGYKNALFKKFDTLSEAQQFIDSSSSSSPSSSSESLIPFLPDYYVYTDGACSNNGKINALAGFGIFFGTDDVRNVSRKIDGKPILPLSLHNSVNFLQLPSPKISQTNNAAELSAIVHTYSIIENDIRSGKKIAIVSDSEYAIKCCSTYGEKCHRKKWAGDIPNKELVKMAYDLYGNLQNSVQFIHILAHTDNTDIHSVGNDHADKLANEAIGLDICPYLRT
jgi:ribonuclease HI